MSTGDRQRRRSGLAAAARAAIESSAAGASRPGAFAVAMRAYQTAVDEWDESVARLLGLNRTDLRCIDLLSLSQSMTAGELARSAGLTSGAMTFVLDRLEQAGVLARHRDDQDRRRVLVQLLPEAAERALQVHLPLVLAMRARLSAFSAEELSAIERFFGIASELYRAHAERLRSEGV